MSGDNTSGKNDRSGPLGFLLRRVGMSPAPYSYRSIASLGCILSFGSIFSILSINSAGSILSIGSAGSILSIGSAGSILSIGSAGKILGIGGKSLLGDDEQK